MGCNVCCPILKEVVSESSLYCHFLFSALAGWYCFHLFRCVQVELKFRFVVRLFGHNIKKPLPDLNLLT